MRTYSLYLTTKSTANPPTKLGIFSWKWQVNWREIFGDRKGYARVRARIVSVESVFNYFYTQNANTGSIRCSLQSNTSNVSNGLNLGLVKPVIDSTYVYNMSSASNGGSNLFPLYWKTPSMLELDTTLTNGTTCIIPHTSSSELVITVLDSTESPMTIQGIIGAPSAPTPLPSIYPTTDKNGQYLFDFQIWLYFDVDDEDPAVPLIQSQNPQDMKYKAW